MDKPKPCISYWAGEWMCIASIDENDWESPVGFGNCPTRAYADWKEQFDAWWSRTYET